MNEQLVATKTEQIIDGVAIQKKILEEISSQIGITGVKPRLGIFLYGANSASELYVKKKLETGHKIGILTEVKNVAEEITLSEAEKIFEEWRDENKFDGIIIQLPIARKQNPDSLIKLIPREADVDNLKNEQDALFDSPTVGAIFAALDSAGVKDFQKPSITIVGSGRLVGEPLSQKLKKMGANPRVATRSSGDLKEMIKDADIVISATGAPKLITGSMIKKNAIVIDAGTAIENSTTVGDIDQATIRETAKSYTPTPGGIGPITVAMLLKNTLKAALSNQKLSR